MSARPSPRRGLALLGALLVVFPVLLAGATDPVPGKAGLISWEAGPGASVRFKGLPGPSPVASAGLPEVNTADLPGSRVVLRKGVFHAGSGPEHQGTSVYAVCLRASSAGLPADLDEVAFDKMNERIEAELKRDGAQVDGFSSGRAVSQGHLTVKPFTGEATPAKPRPGVKNRLHGKNFLGFLGEPPEALLCSVACLETSTSNNLYCGPVAESFSLEGAFVTPPRPGFFVGLAHASIRRPAAAIGVLLGGLLAVLGVALLAWPARRA